MAVYDHLPLRRLEGTLERRQHGFGKVVPRDAKAHGGALQGNVAKIVADHKLHPPIADVDPALILKIKTVGAIPEDAWAGLGMTLLSNEPDKSLVLFASDTELTEFKRRLVEYQKAPPAGQKNPRYAALIGAIESVSELAPSDRIGAVLREEGFEAPEDFADDANQTVDIELWQPDLDTILNFVARVERIVQDHEGTLVNEYRGSTMTLIRVTVAGAGIRALLSLPEISILDRPPQPDSALMNVAQFDVGNIGPVTVPDQNSLVIGVIDSGLIGAHPLLAGIVRGAFGVPAALGDSDERGHGTAVSGIAVYGDVRQRAETGQFNANFFVASAKVVNQQGRFADESLLPATMEGAIRRLHDEFGCRVINVSLADRKRMASEKPTPWAAILDELARELDLIIVVSTGNRTDLFAAYGDGIVDAYPQCLTDPSARIFEPATAINAVTVGSLAHSNGISADDGEHVGVIPLTQYGHPSPFTRTGPGTGKIMKPDFVDFGGTVVFDGPTQTLADGTRRAAAGVLSLNRDYVTQLLTSVSGTSFAAPLVAYKAAMLRESFSGASANLIRALMAISSDHPVETVACLDGLSENQVLNVLGHGVIDIERAMNSDDDRVILYREDALPVNKFAVFEVPIPEIFQNEKGTRQIRAALAFDPIVRHTRLDYAGLSMSIDLFRGATAEEVFDACRKWEQDEGEPLKIKGAKRCDMTPGPRLRGYGTLQCGTFIAQRSLQAYGETYYLVVRCEGGWASALTPNQEFSVVVELQHSAEIDLYQRVRARVQLPA